MDITPERIAKAYSDLIAAKKQLALAASTLSEHESVLRWARFGALREGHITGKNADEREACERKLLVEQYEDVEEWGRVVATQRYACEVAALVVEQLRTEMRLAELQAAAPPPQP